MSAVLSPVELLQTPEKMRNWLASLPPPEFVGIPRSFSKCPIVTYLNAQGIMYARAGLSHVHWNSFSNMAGLPDWARDFVSFVDNTSHDEPITAAYAITLLHAVIEKQR